MKNIKVLIVDDETHIADLLSRTLKLAFKDQIDVVISKTAESAFRLLSTAPFDVLITDWHLPGISGLSLILRARKFYPQLKIVFMTASPMDEIEERVKMVADISVMKPFKASMLATQVQNLFQQRA